jgi:hypothetical protein
MCVLNEKRCKKGGAKQLFQKVAQNPWFFRFAFFLKGKFLSLPFSKKKSGAKPSNLLQNINL